MTTQSGGVNIAAGGNTESEEASVTQVSGTGATGSQGNRSNAGDSDPPPEFTDQGNCKDLKKWMELGTMTTKMSSARQGPRVLRKLSKSGMGCL